MASVIKTDNAMDKKDKWNKMWSSEDPKWRTPTYVFDFYDKIYGFNLDAAASKQNAKCRQFLTQKDNSLDTNWYKKGRVIWLNPPYSRQMGAWIEKAYKESQKGCTVACLIYARTDTKWWHDYVMKAWKIHFIKGRIKFLTSNKGQKSAAAPAPSCLVVFKPNRKRVPTIVSDIIPEK